MKRRKPPVAPPESARPASPQAPSAEIAAQVLPDAPDASEPPPLIRLSVVVLGAALLALPYALGLSGPPRAPAAGAFVAGFSALCGVVALFVAARRPLRAPTEGAGLGWLTAEAPGLVVLSASAALIAALGLLPETFAWPTRGIGERLFGFPALVGLPLAGAALLARRPVIAGAGCALALAGLLQPFPVLDDLAPAVVHAALRTDAADGILLLAFVGLAAAGLLSPLFGGRGALLWPVLGAGLACLLPAAQALRLVEGAESLPLVGLVAGATLLLVEGLRAAPRAPGPVVKRAALSVEGLFLLGTVTLFLLLKAFTWRWSTTDENIYFYGAVAITRGTLPYRDFFFAHPPMHIVVPAVIFQVFGFSIAVAKAIPVVATLVTGGLLWHLARPRLGPLTALFTLIAFFFAHELLQASTNMNGVELTSLWLTLGLWGVQTGRPRLAGVALGLSVTTGFYAIGGALALVAMALARELRTGLRVAVVFAAVGGAINLLFYGIGGEAYLQAVYGYHMAKEQKPLIGEFLKTTYHHAPLVLGLALAPLVGAWQRFTNHAPLMAKPDQEVAGSFFAPFKLVDEPALGTVKVVWLLAVSLVFEFTLFQEIYGFYFALIFPAAALCTGYAVAGIAGSVVHGLEALRTGKLAPLGVAAALTVGYGLWVPLTVETNWAFSHPGKPGVDANGKRDRFPPPAKGVNPEWLELGERRDYPWIAPAALDPWATRVVRSLFWRDHRLKGAVVPGHRHFLWQKALHFDAADAVGAFVKETAAPDETVAGNSLVAPAVALLAERRISAEYVDTNGKRFNTGLEKLQSFFEAICKDNVRYLVAAPSGFMSNDLFERVPTVTRYFQRAKDFPSPMNKFDKPGVPPFAVTLWEVKDRTATPRCTWLPGSPVP